MDDKLLLSWLEKQTNATNEKMVNNTPLNATDLTLLILKRHIANLKDLDGQIKDAVQGAVTEKVVADTPKVEAQSRDIQSLSSSLAEQIAALSARFDTQGERSSILEMQLQRVRLWVRSTLVGLVVALVFVYTAYLFA